jgi:hypothetical protein
MVVGVEEEVAVGTVNGDKVRFAVGLWEGIDEKEVVGME